MKAIFRRGRKYGLLRGWAPFGVICFVLMAAAAARAVEPPARPIAELVAKLNDPSWCVREAASQDLMELGSSAYEPLKAAFTSGTSYEVRRRIKEVVRESYLSASGGMGIAFLGIRMDPSAEPRIAPEVVHAVRVQTALECSAAEAAGIRTDDIVVAINGDSLTAESFSRSLTGWIQDQKPATEGVIGVLRGAKSVRVQTTDVAVLDRLSKMETEVVNHAADARVAPGMSAIKIMSDVIIADGVRLAAGDLIVGIDPGADADSFSPANRKMLADWIAAQSKPAPVKPAGGAAQAAPMVVRAGRLTSQTPCLYAIHGGEWLDLVVRLRRLPERSVQDVGGAGVQRIADRLKAEAAFELWWQETFDPTGLVSENKAAHDPSWRLTPRGRRG